MKQKTSRQKSTRNNEHIRDQDVAGSSSIAFTPPAYGINVVDSSIAQREMNQPNEISENRAVAPDVEQAIRAVRGSGQPLDGHVRTQMEPAFGADFRSVRVHTDSGADRLNRALNARAFTTGQDIFFKEGEYSPGSSGGRELIAHELTHVVQQNGGLKRTVQRLTPDKQIEEMDNQGVGDEQEGEKWDESLNPGQSFEQTVPEEDGKPPVQTKLILGKPGDCYEQEADQVAQAIMRQEYWGVVQKDINQELFHRQAKKDEQELPGTKTKCSHLQKHAYDDQEEKFKIKAENSGDHLQVEERINREKCLIKGNIHSKIVVGNPSNKKPKNLLQFPVKQVLRRRNRSSFNPLVQRRNAEFPLRGIHDHPKTIRGRDRKRRVTHWKQLDDDDIKTAIEFNKRYNFKRSIKIINQLVKPIFPTFNIEAIAKYQQRKGIRIDGQIGDITLSRFFWDLRRGGNVDNINKAIFLVRDGRGYSVTKVKSIEYDTTMTEGLYWIKDHVQIYLGRKSITNYNTFKYALRESIRTVQRGPGRKRPPGIKPTPKPPTGSCTLSRGEILKLAEDYFYHSFGWSTPPEVKNCEKKVRDEIAKCKRWWKSSEATDLKAGVHDSRRKMSFQRSGRIYIIIGCKKLQHGGKEPNWRLDGNLDPNLIFKIVKKNGQKTYRSSYDEIDVRATVIRFNSEATYRCHEASEVTREARVKQLHKDRLNNVGSWSGSKEKRALNNEWLTYKREVSRRRVKSTVKGLEALGYKGLRVSYPAHPKYTFPMCCSPITKAGVQKVEPTEYDDLILKIYKLYGEERAKHPKKALRVIYNKHRNTIGKPMSIFCGFILDPRRWTENQFLDKDDVNNFMKGTHTSVLNVTYMDERILSYVSIYLKKGYSDGDIAREITGVWKLVIEGDKRYRKWSQGVSTPQIAKRLKILNWWMVKRSTGPRYVLYYLGRYR